jgi:hypothetical protein
MHAAGVTTPIASFVCAVTQFLSSTDLSRLNRVCRTDHLALDSLWNTCATKCKGQLPVLELRRGTEAGGGGCNPRDTAYLWSVAHAVVTRWIQRLNQTAMSSVCHSFMLTSHGCTHCRPMSWPCHNTEYVVSASRHIEGDTHAITTASDDHLTCPHLRRIWFDATGIDIQQAFVTNSRFQIYGPRSLSLPSTVLRVLICLGPQIAYTFLTHKPLLEPFADVWFSLGVMPQMPITTSMLPADIQDKLQFKWHNLVTFVDL